MSQARPITPGQVRAVHAALPRAGLDDAAYRLLLGEVYGVRSCKELSSAQANELLANLNLSPRPRPKPQPRPARRRAARQAPGGKVIRLASEAQRVLIGRLAGGIEWRAEDGLGAWMRRSLGLDAVRTGDDARRVIEGLKAMRRRARAQGRP